MSQKVLRDNFGILEMNSDVFFVILTKLKLSLNFYRISFEEKLVKNEN